MHVSKCLRPNPVSLFYMYVPVNEYSHHKQSTRHTCSTFFYTHMHLVPYCLYYCYWVKMWLCNTTRAKSRRWITMKFHNKHSSVNWDYWWRNIAVIFKKTEIIWGWYFREIKIVFHNCADSYSFVKNTCPTQSSSLWSSQ